MRTVVVTAVGSFSAPAVIRSLQEAGYRVVGTDYNPQEYLANSVAVDRFVRVPGFREEEALLQVLEGLMKEEHAVGLIPLTDAELDLLNKNRDRFPEGSLWASPSEAVLISRNKRKAAERIAEAGIFPPCAEVIPTWYLTDLFGELSPEQAAADAEKRGLFPLILKPENGRSSQGLYRISGPEEFAAALKEIRTEAGGLYQEAGYLLQPMIAGRVVTADVVRDRSGRTLALLREEHVRTHNGAGLTVRVYRNPEMEAVCGRIAGLFGILGCVNMEFVLDEQGVYHFLEVNPRFSGGTGFSVAAGLDVVKLHLAVFADQGDGTPAIPEENPARPCWIARKYVEVVTKAPEYDKLN